MEKERMAVLIANMIDYLFEVINNDEETKETLCRIGFTEAEVNEFWEG